jgi:hypothetical protein
MPERWNTSSGTLQPSVKIQWNFAALCQNRFFNASGTYEDFLKNLKFYILYDRRRF